MQITGKQRALRAVQSLDKTLHQTLPPKHGRIITPLAFFTQLGPRAEVHKEGKNVIKWTRLSCRKFRDNAVRLQLHALAYNFANFMRTLALPKEVEHWSLTTLRA